jgi:DNA polymerase-1
MTIFTLTPKAEPKALIILPEKVCNMGAANFLLTKLIQPLGLSVNDFAFAGAYVPEKGRLKKDDFISEFNEILSYCEVHNIKVLGCGNSGYYEWLTGDKKFQLNIGRIVKGINIAEDFSVAPILNPVILNMFPDRAKELHRGISAIKNLLSGTYTDPVETLDLTLNAILKDPQDIYIHLKAWIDAPELFVDIETTGLAWYNDKILTISFGLNEKEAFCVAVHEKYHDTETYMKIVKTLKAFFTQYKGKLIGHNWIGFDQAFIVHEIMRGFDFSIDHAPIINMFNLEDSMLLAYVEYNSTERPSLGLKELAFSFMGEYDADIDQKNLYNADLYKVATYNNYDVIATCRIWKQLKAEVAAESLPLYDVYQEIRDIAHTLLKVKMNGLRVNKEGVKAAIAELDEMIVDSTLKFRDHPVVRTAEELLNKAAFKKHNSTLKNKKTWADYKANYYEPFNPSSPKQKQFLFFEVLNLPIVKVSKTSKLPSTDAESFEEWMTMDLPKDTREVLELIQDIQTAEKVNNTYLRAFYESSVEVKPGHWKVFTNFNSTGTISGRLSSSGGLNFQNLPSNSKYGKLIKKLLISDDGYIILASDFAALEDRLIAIEANDKNKLRVFTDGIDGHSLNAYAYFKDKLEERGIIIDIDSAKSINRIKTEAPDLRQLGKSVTFGLNYGSSPKKIASQLGVSIQEAEKIYQGYWELYAPTKAYNDLAIEEARTTGAVVSTFSGLRVKMASINARDEYLRSKEERRAANFKIQSGNFLTLRALHGFQKAIEDADMLGKVFVTNTVHDSLYLQSKADEETIKWVNDTLIGLMCRDYKENQAIKLEAELDLGFSQKDMITIKNNCPIKEISIVLEELQGH